MGRSEPLGSPARGLGQATFPVNCKAGTLPTTSLAVPHQNCQAGSCRLNGAWPSSGPSAGR